VPVLYPASCQYGTNLRETSSSASSGFGTVSDRPQAHPRQRRSVACAMLFMTEAAGLTEPKIKAARSKLITGNHLGASCTPTRHRRSSNASNAADYSSLVTQMYDSSSGLQYGNLGFEVGCSKLEFLWDPYLNSSALQNEIVSGGSSSQNHFPLQLKGPQRSIVATCWWWTLACQASG
jgi:hypothetical protein